MWSWRRYHSLVLLLLILVEASFGWNRWDYLTTWSSFSRADASIKETSWKKTWDEGILGGKTTPPRARTGHSLHLIKTDSRSVYKGDTYIVLFGGRDNDQNAIHIPKTYNVETVNGSVEFTTYEDKPVSACNDPDNIYYSPAETAQCNFTQSSTIRIGVVYNDVWAYKLCNHTDDASTERYFDTACEETGWELWSPGAKEGGCAIELGIEVCTTPSERYNHGSILFDDGTLYVYGGFSQRCGDYCDDLWFFDIYLRSWREVYPAGKLTKFYTDTFFGETITLNDTDVPKTNTTSKFAGPSRRWRHSMVAGKKYTDPVDQQEKQDIAIFGGHRLWHGFSPENNQDNNWGVFETRPEGGYLDDLWIYTKYLDYSFPGDAYKESNGLWKLRQVQEQCFPDPGLSWNSRNQISCTTVRPVGRAGHGSAFDSDRQIVWIFGGYNSYYPYLSTDGLGSGPGSSSVGSGGFIPYPGYDYFLNDLWYYNLTSSLWIKIEVPEGSPVPDPRVDMVFLLLGDIIFMHGGYADNHIYGDTWYFNITTKRWLEKTTFVRPIYPPSCTDDFEYIRKHKECFNLTWPKALERAESYPFDILPYAEQDYYWPDATYTPAGGPYYGIFNRSINSSAAVARMNLKVSQQAAIGTPMVPYAATGLRQYVKPFFYSFNATHNATLFSYCTSVFAEPTRGKKLDGLYGRANASIFIAQPRPQKPGWDGCRDRYDGRTDLKNELKYVQPLPRYGHRAVFHENTSEILFYGGTAYYAEQPVNTSYSYDTLVLSDMWYYHLYHCVNNCSGHGDCYYGFCFCYVGYYGVDCSNVSCPGTFCHYDRYTHEQICTHACQAGYHHTDNDTYVQDIAKIPCSLEHPGESNGICDGFGTAMCAPPFLTSDCSVKDCPNNCSFNGWCSIEYPVSRCMCQPGYFGVICDQIQCLNNCSYPNGICNTTTGVCDCNMMYSPYNNTREYKPWGGEDCSYLFPYAAAPSMSLNLVLALVLISLLLVYFYILGEVEDQLQILKRQQRANDPTFYETEVRQRNRMIRDVNTKVAFK